MPQDIASQRRSSISSPARSSKKAGAPKAKGAVRAKSGCYTCRIRRKKCDERQDRSGSCETCIRLRLQCLGFGAKRPDYLKDTKNVSDIREKIKSFLASNGMIKGHSNPGTRSAEEEPSMLRIVDDYRHSSTSSPHSESMSPDISEGYRSHLMTSHVRDGPEPQYELAIAADSPYSHTVHPHMQQQLAPDSPPCAPRRFGPGGDSDILHPLSMPPPHLSNSLALISPSAPAWHNEARVPVAVPPSYPSLSMHSSYGALYHDPVQYDDVYDREDYSSPSGTSPPMAISTYGFAPSNELVCYYIQNVARQQYLLADDATFQSIWNIVSRSDSAYNAACFLSALHRERSSDSNSPYYVNVETALFRPGHAHTENDIMAGLMVISSFLFKGGRGSWPTFLEIARNWVRRAFHDPRFQGPEHVLKQCSAGTRFIIKTTMWFDVLASITELKPPSLLPIYKDLWGRFTSDYGESDPDLSMITPMGCDNETFLALAEISELAWWKDAQVRKNQLSYMELIERGKRIEATYLRRVSSPSVAGQISQLDERRRLTSNIFRASARLYLHSILSGDHPGIPEIRDAVTETIECLKAVPPGGDLSRSIVRSVVFSICICGCLTDDQEHRKYLLERLREQEKVSEIGNCTTVKNVMRTVWDKRDANLRQWGGGSRSSYLSSPPVNWREVMQENNQGLLLLV